MKKMENKKLPPRSGTLRSKVVCSNSLAKTPSSKICPAHERLISHCSNCSRSRSLACEINKNIKHWFEMIVVLKILKNIFWML